MKLMTFAGLVAAATLAAGSGFGTIRFGTADSTGWNNAGPRSTPAPSGR